MGTSMGTSLGTSPGTSTNFPGNFDEVPDACTLSAGLPKRLLTVSGKSHGSLCGVGRMGSPHQVMLECEGFGVFTRSRCTVGSFGQWRYGNAWRPAEEFRAACWEFRDSITSRKFPRNFESNFPKNFLRNFDKQKLRRELRESVTSARNS